MTRREEVLRWVNREREESGLPPLPDLEPGYPGEAESCTLAHSLGGADVCPATPANPASGYYIDDYLIDHPLPPFVSAFARAFDKGRYPDLIEKDSS